MFKKSHLILLAVLLLLPMTAAAQEIQAEEHPEPGFRSLGPRTVVSFVRQSLPDLSLNVAETQYPLFNSILHVTNTGNAPMAGAAIFVSSHGQQKRAMRHFGVQPGQTLSLSVAQIIDGDHTDLPDVVTGIVILRFFAPLDVGADSFFSQMVSAEQHIGAGPDGPGHILPLRVDTPQQLILRRERR